MSFKASLRSNKNTEMKEYEYLTLPECEHLSGHCLVLDRNGNVATVKIISVKTWKTRPDVKIGWKYRIVRWKLI